MTASWFAVWTATITQCEPASYWVLPASPPSSTCATTVLVVASITKSRRPDSSETETRRCSGAYAIPSGNRAPGPRATIRKVEARRAPRQRDVGDHAQGRLRRRRRRNGARPAGLHRWAGERAWWSRHLRYRGEHDRGEHAREHEPSSLRREAVHYLDDECPV